MYFKDNKQHSLPHIHVRYQEYEGVFTIPEGNLIEGKIPNPKVRLVQAWIEIHQEELMANWTLAIDYQPVFKIEPLK